MNEWMNEIKKKCYWSITIRKHSCATTSYTINYLKNRFRYVVREHRRENLSQQHDDYTTYSRGRCWRWKTTGKKKFVFVYCALMLLTHIHTQNEKVRNRGWRGTGEIKGKETKALNEEKWEKNQNFYFILFFFLVLVKSWGSEKGSGIELKGWIEKEWAVLTGHKSSENSYTVKRDFKV